MYCLHIAYLWLHHTSYYCLTVTHKNGMYSKEQISSTIPTIPFCLTTYYCFKKQKNSHSTMQIISTDFGTLKVQVYVRIVSVRELMSTTAPTDC